MSTKSQAPTLAELRKMLPRGKKYLITWDGELRIWTDASNEVSVRIWVGDEARTRRMAARIIAALREEEA